MLVRVCTCWVRRVRYGEYGSDAAVMGTSADRFASTSPAMLKLTNGGGDKRFGCVTGCRPACCAVSHVSGSGKGGEVQALTRLSILHTHARG